MTDIFNNTILCGKCDTQMTPIRISKNGFVLRAIACNNCGNKTVHPKDAQEYNDFINLKKKQFNVKMRFVGNSYAVSIPREIVNFMREQEQAMDDMVKLCFEEFGRISLKFGDNPIHNNIPPNPLNKDQTHNELHNKNLNDSKKPKEKEITKLKELDRGVD